MGSKLDGPCHHRTARSNGCAVDPKNMNLTCAGPLIHGWFIIKYRGPFISMGFLSSDSTICKWKTVFSIPSRGSVDAKSQL